LETRRIKTGVSWENEEDESPMPPGDIKMSEAELDDVEFDSQDDDECEDVFAGVWSPKLALKRRRGRRFGREGVRVSNVRARSEETL